MHEVSKYYYLYGVVEHTFVVKKRERRTHMTCQSKSGQYHNGAKRFSLYSEMADEPFRGAEQKKNEHVQMKCNHNGVCVRIDPCANSVGKLFSLCTGKWKINIQQNGF